MYRYIVIFVLILAVLLGPVAGAAPNETDEPTAHSPLEDGTVRGDPAVVSGVESQGVHLQAANQSYVESDLDVDEAGLNGRYTITGWIKLDDRSGMHYFVGDDGYKYSNPAIYVYSDGTPEFRVHWSRDSTDTSTAVTGEAGAIDAGTWYHLVGTLETTGERTTIAFYVNGRLIGSASTTEAPDYQGKITVGRGIWNHEEVYANATVSDVTVYDRPLSSAEVRATYTDGTPLSPWRFAYLSDVIVPVFIGLVAVAIAIVETGVRS